MYSHFPNIKKNMSLLPMEVNKVGWQFLHCNVSKNRFHEHIHVFKTMYELSFRLTKDINIFHSFCESSYKCTVQEAKFLYIQHYYSTVNSTRSV